MSELTVPEDPMQTVYFLGLRAGARVVCEAAGSHDGWDSAATARNVDAELDAILSRDQQTMLYGAIRDILAGRAPSPFASSTDHSAGAR